MSNQQKRSGFLHIYKGNNQRKKEDHPSSLQESNSNSSPIVVVEMEEEKKKKKKSNYSISRNWLTRISKARSLGINNNNGDGTQRRGSSESSDQKEVVIVEARKSTSCIESVGYNNNNVVEAARKSISAVATESEELGEGRVIVEGRKSVSHIETNAARKGDYNIVEGRKSVSQIETLSSVIAYLQVKVLVSDMPSFMQVHAFRCARRTYDSLEEFSSKHIAHNIKKVRMQLMLASFTILILQYLSLCDSFNLKLSKSLF